MNVKSRPVFLVPILGLGLLSGCASLQTTESGFLSDYSELKLDEDKPNCKIFVAEGLNIDSYGSVEVAPILFSVPEAKLKRLNDEDVAKFSEESQVLIEDVFQGLVSGSESSATGDLVVKVAITDVDTVRVGVNAVAAVVAVPVDNGGVSVELEILDKKTGRRLFALSGYETGKIKQVGGFFSKLGHARAGLGKIAKNVVEMLEENLEPKAG